LSWIVAGSLATGAITAALLAFAPFIPAHESAVTGALLCGYALGWAMLALLSVRFTDQPQRWAALPAALMGVGGLLLLVFGSPMREALSWVWPPAVLGTAVWMLVRVRRDLRSRAGRLLLYPVVAGLALASIGAGFETVREAADARAYSMPGRLVDVGGRSLHLSCTGTGSPTVVLQPGAGEMSSNLGWITPAVAAHTRVCVYDRAGRGWSDPANTPQDASQIAADLHLLLQRAHVPGPYVLAGHSFGGLYTLTYAAHYPHEVAGMVLIDSTAPSSAATQATRPAAGSYDVTRRVSTLASTLARVGLGRLVTQLSFGSLPPQARGEVQARLATADNLSSTIEEYVLASASTREAAELRDFGDKPLVVLTAGTGSAAGWTTSQNHLATLSTNTVHRVVAGATHEMLVADEKDAAITSQAILDVVRSVRHAASSSN
jgi:pimeloyl-ACP methyl ester carboxylesterase